jgi:transglutaminase-like putative cysteine protease
MHLSISHLTRYTYSQPVSFAPHLLYLRPRFTPRQRVRDFRLTIAPAARRIATNDALDNAIDWAYFAPETRATQLELWSDFRVDTLDSNPFDFFLPPSATVFPFSYETPERIALTPSLTPRVDTPAPELRAWLNQHLPQPPAETMPFLTALNQAVHDGLNYRVRTEEGIQNAAQTLALGTGSCRDFAVFLIELCRIVGVAARFVSGYVFDPPPPGTPNPAPPEMHAWAEVYLPGGGWRGLDPTRALFCDDAYVPVAHSAIAETVNPVQGKFTGPAGTTSQLFNELRIQKIAG